MNIYRVFVSLLKIIISKGHTSWEFEFDDDIDRSQIWKLLVPFQNHIYVY